MTNETKKLVLFTALGAIVTTIITSLFGVSEKVVNKGIKVVNRVIEQESIDKAQNKAIQDRLRADSAFVLVSNFCHDIKQINNSINDIKIITSEINSNQYKLIKNVTIINEKVGLYYLNTMSLQCDSCAIDDISMSYQ